MTNRKHNVVDKASVGPQQRQWPTIVHGWAAIMANASMRAAAAQYINPAPQLSHKTVVVRLYRKSLKTLNSWAIDREVFLSEAGKLRASFSANAHLAPESGKVKALVRKAHEELLRYSHPDKYILPWMPGGTLFMRNPPLPFDVVFAGHVPEDVKEEPLNIDMTPVVKGEKGDGRVLVDSANKAYF